MIKDIMSCATDHKVSYTISQKPFDALLASPLLPIPNRAEGLQE